MKASGSAKASNRCRRVVGLHEDGHDVRQGSVAQGVNIPLPDGGAGRGFGCGPARAGGHAYGSKGMPAGLAAFRRYSNEPSLILMVAEPKSADISLSRSAMLG
jgi:hypothetical protein